MKKSKRIIFDILFEIIGSFIVGIALYNFALTAGFPMTGFSGIAMILYRLWNLPIGIMTIILNIPVALLCYKLLGKGFFIRSIRCMIISSLFIDYICPLFPVYSGEKILACICTGVLTGLGYALIFSRYSSTGGADFIIMAIKNKKPHLSVGKITFAFDTLIILLGGFIFNDINGIIYGIILNYIVSIVIDKLMYGINSGKLALIITNNGKDVIKTITINLDRGATLINGYGGYTLDHKDIVLCACSNKEMIMIEKEIKKIDPQAFTIILESNEVLGEGFKNLKVAETPGEEIVEIKD